MTSEPLNQQAQSQIIGEGIDLLTLHYHPHRLPGHRSIQSIEILRRKWGPIAEGFQLPNLLLSRRAVAIRMTVVKIKTAFTKICGYLNDRVVMICTLRHCRGFEKPDVKLVLRSHIFDSFSADEIISCARAWLQCNILCDITPREVKLIEVVSRVDYRHDLLVAAHGLEDLDSSAMNRVISRLPRVMQYGEEKFTGWTMGSKRRLFYNLYDKGYQLMKKGRRQLCDQLQIWKVRGLKLEPDETLTLQNSPVKIWRHEWRFNRNYLREQKITNFEDFLNALVMLKYRVYHQIVVMRTLGRRSRVRSCNPVDSHWSILQESCPMPSGEVDTPIVETAPINPAINRRYTLSSPVAYSGLRRDHVIQRTRSGRTPSRDGIVPSALLRVLALPHAAENSRRTDRNIQFSLRTEEFHAHSLNVRYGRYIRT